MMVDSFVMDIIAGRQTLSHLIIAMVGSKKGSAMCS